MYDNAKIMTLSEMAEYLKIAKRSLLRMAQRGDIPATKVASQWRFMRSVVDDWLISRMKAMPDHELEELVESEEFPLPLAALFRPELVRLDIRDGTKERVQARLVADSRYLLEKLIEREEMVSTAIFPGIAIPHVRKPEECPVAETRVVLGVSRQGVDFDSLDGRPTRALFLICADQVIVHLKIIAELALLFRRPRLLQELVAAQNPREALKVLFAGGGSD
jgi:PTS system nitrogen regulatory IIA component